VSSSASAARGERAAWSGPDDIVERLRRMWDRGELLAKPFAGENMFPMRLRLKRPNPRDLAEHFDSVRAWIWELEEHGRAKRGYGYELVWAEINHRQLGRNRLPEAVLIPKEYDALALLGKAGEAEAFRRLAATSIAAFPSLRDLILRKPLALLEHADDWERILAVLAWFESHPQSGLYLRQVDIPGIGTKFIEARKALFQELLDTVLPPSQEARATENPSFERRYGLRSKPAIVRFRILDPRLAICGLTDLAAPVEQFAALQIPAARVFIAENEINGLCFPKMESSIVIFALGYGVEILRDVPWLANRNTMYWGDIDTHGFAILGRLRGFLPEARSLLMDRQTLLAHRNFWTVEDAPCGRLPEGLTCTERDLFEDLLNNRLGGGVRLEQERVRYLWLVEALRRAR
jgi:hypothetical protein